MGITYEADLTKVPRKCILCNKRITDTEFEFEDYFVVFRGYTETAIEGFICFRCLKGVIK